MSVFESMFGIDLEQFLLLVIQLVIAVGSIYLAYRNLAIQREISKLQSKLKRKEIWFGHYLEFYSQLKLSLNDLLWNIMTKKKNLKEINSDINSLKLNTIGNDIYLTYRTKKEVDTLLKFLHDLVSPNKEKEAFDKDLYKEIGEKFDKLFINLRSENIKFIDLDKEL